MTLDLRPGAFSSTHGMTYNISLAYVPEDAPDELAGYIENARGGAGNDVLTGNDRDNVLIGNDGHDTLIGLDGDDELRGGGGNDRLEGGFGTDWFDGGGGTDTVDYTYSSGNWTIGLAADLDDHGRRRHLGNRDHRRRRRKHSSTSRTSSWDPATTMSPARAAPTISPATAETTR